VFEKIRKDPPFAALGAILAVAVATIAGAFVFQALGYAPCELCLKERMPYYAGIIVAAIAFTLVAGGFRRVIPWALALLALIFVGSLIFGAYHAGVEWEFWRGPSDCTGAIPKSESMTDFLQQLQTVKVVRCDAVAIRIFGLSLAGWNAVVSALLSGIAVAGLLKRRAGI
jgi:disulfide bond formation protein DsbB